MSIISYISKTDKSPDKCVRPQLTSIPSNCHVRIFHVVLIWQWIRNGPAVPKVQNPWLESPATEDWGWHICIFQLRCNIERSGWALFVFHSYRLIVDFVFCLLFLCVLFNVLVYLSLDCYLWFHLASASVRLFSCLINTTILHRGPTFLISQSLP